MPAIKGTASVVDSRALQRSLKRTKFPANFHDTVDLRRVNRAVLSQWIEKRVTELLGLEDEIVASTAINLFLPNVDTTTVSSPVDPKKAQIDLSGFLGETAGAIFSAEVWELMLDAQTAPLGIPRKLVEEKKKELSRQPAAVHRTERAAPEARLSPRRDQPNVRHHREAGAREPLPPRVDRDHRRTVRSVSPDSRPTRPRVRHNERTMDHTDTTYDPRRYPDRRRDYPPPPERHYERHEYYGEPPPPRGGLDEFGRPYRHDGWRGGDPRWVPSNGGPYPHDVTRDYSGGPNNYYQEHDYHRYRHDRDYDSRRNRSDYSNNKDKRTHRYDYKNRPEGGRPDRRARRRRDRSQSRSNSTESSSQSPPRDRNRSRHRSRSQSSRGSSSSTTQRDSSSASSSGSDDQSMSPAASK